MGEKTGIEWTDSTWNPIRARNRNTGKIGWHCEHVSEACRFCYAESMNRRLGTGLDFKPGHRADIDIFLDEKMLLAPLRWNKPRRIFVNSMTDTFAEFVTDEWLDRLFAVMALAPRHTFQVLTKRPERMNSYLSAARAHPVGMEAMGITLDAHALDQHSNVGLGVALKSDIPHLEAWPLPNVWLGVSAEDQAAADERIPLLLATPAAVRFVSLEPLLGPIDLTRIDDGAAHRDIPREEWGSADDDDSPPSLWWDVLTGRRTIMHGGATGEWSRRDASLDWVIAGGESGKGARPMHPAWARSLRDQCAAAGVPFFFKQWGEWFPNPLVGTANGCFLGDRFTTTIPWNPGGHPEGATCMRRVGKKSAGRLLNGRQHNGMPGAP